MDYDGRKKGKKLQISYLLTFLIGFGIGCSILSYASAQLQTDSKPIGTIAEQAVSSTTPQLQETGTVRDEEIITTTVIVNKPTVIVNRPRIIESRPSDNSSTSSGMQDNGDGVSIRHLGYTEDDYRQDITNYAYKLGGMDLVILMECESGMNPKANGDKGKARGLCQMNTNYHKLPQEYYTSRQTQVELCAEKRKGGTVFYGPDRIIKGQKCSAYVKSRFDLTTKQ